MKLSHIELRKKDGYHGFDLLVDGHPIGSFTDAVLETGLPGDVPKLTVKLLLSEVEVDATGVEVFRVVTCPECQKRQGESIDAK